MKTAIIHDVFVDRGGAERMLKYFKMVLPDADIYTTAYLPKYTYDFLQDFVINSTWYDKIAISPQLYRKLYFPLGYFASKSIDLRDYELIFQSTTHGAKYCKTDKNSLIISYCYTPFRLLWDTSSYPSVLNANLPIKILYNLIISYFKNIDYNFAQRANYYIAMTKETAERIGKFYNKSVIKIINPPVECSRFFVSSSIDDYYLVVSRLEPYKKIDLVVKAFNMIGKKLVIVGGGTEEQKLKSIAKKNIIFLGRQCEENVAKLYSNCVALIVPQHEDYGLTPLEANASGRPVIAYNRGGVLETMIQIKQYNEKGTALFFENQSIEDILKAVDKLEKCDIDATFIRSHSEKYDVPVFTDKLRYAIDECKNLFNAISI